MTTKKRKPKGSQSPYEETPSIEQLRSRYLGYPSRLTLSQAADIIGCIPANLRRMCRNGAIKGAKKEKGPVNYWTVPKSWALKYGSTPQSEGYPRGRPKTRKRRRRTKSSG